MQANVADDESCLCMPCRIACSSMTLRVFTTLGTFEFVQESLSKTTSNPLDKAYLGTMKCVFVGKAFKKVATEQTKFKQIKR